MTWMSQYSSLKLDRDAGLLRIGLNRPDKLNALNYKTLRELEDVWLDVQRDRSVDVVVLYGEGRAFSSGGDLQDLVDPELLESVSPAGLISVSRRLVLNMLQVEQPIVAAVHGVATGLAANLVLLADIMVMGESARIADTHVRIGLAAGDSGTVIWPLVMPINRAKEYLITGDFVTSDDAVAMGLTRHVVVDDEVLPVAEEVARGLASGPLVAMRGTKMAVNQIILERFEKLMNVSGLAEEISFASRDHTEAREAFLAKREPRFEGR